MTAIGKKLEGHTRRETRAWAAGLFEGEGYVYFKRHVRRDTGRFRSQVVVGMTNTETALLRPLRDTWGGTIRPHPGSALTRKQCYEWRVYGMQSETFLRDIQPFVRATKAPKIDRALKLRSLIVTKTPRTSAGVFSNKEAVCL